MIDRGLRVGAFIGVFLLANCLMTLVWECFLHENVYDCNDSLPFGYLQPGSWVHEPIVYVDTIVQGNLAYAGDAILSGWSMDKLWLIWFAMFGITVAVSWFLAKSLSSARKDSGAGQVAAEEY